jgi:hypothetical protein
MHGSIQTWVISAAATQSSKPRSRPRDTMSESLSGQSSIVPSGSLSCGSRARPAIDNKSKARERDSMFPAGLALRFISPPRRLDVGQHLVEIDHVGIAASDIAQVVVMRTFIDIAATRFGHDNAKAI